MAEQLSLNLPVRPALGRDDFFVTSANAIALALVEGWPNWHHGKLAIIGPAGSGKTHLAHVWAAQSGARIVSAKNLTRTDIPSLAQGPVAVENVPEIADDPDAQAALFHLHNLTLAEGHSLLFTGIAEPKHWGLSLPDLASRMQGTTTAALSEPDDTLLTVLLGKLFADRQLVPTPDTIPYLVRQIDRSYAAARALVEDLDRESLAQQRPITRAFASKHLKSRAA
ncbi:chromosomal replication initiator DnaA [Cognatishimia sp. SS12]|uniref:chromosomal replication initiator DnaA n=1 Tax=Cognatishimia sp. SS12 TaxID=2979465 RepID=UPI00232F407B|nr:chromosomal replication initiator DnaA [Cognatishimia sp. SS12]MDC0738581.1 chromosomal replication initiator DnaA [Cognatishimia sp. SS12]